VVTVEAMERENEVGQHEGSGQEQPKVTHLIKREADKCCHYCHKVMVVREAFSLICRREEKDYPVERHLKKGEDKEVQEEDIRVYLRHKLIKVNAAAKQKGDKEKVDAGTLLSYLHMCLAVMHGYCHHNA
jgi:hypothetical protein